MSELLSVGSNRQSLYKPYAELDDVIKITWKRSCGTEAGAKFLLFLYM